MSKVKKKLQRRERLPGYPSSWETLSFFFRTVVDPIEVDLETHNIS
jgi:hypothetical protein